MKYRVAALLILVLLIASLAGVQVIKEKAVPAYSEQQPETPVNTVSAPVESEEASIVEAKAPTETSEAAAETTVKEPELNFTAVGDILLGRGVGSRLKKAGSYTYAFSDVEDILRQGDVIFANLESPLTDSTHGLDKNKKIVLKSSPDSIEAIKSGGFNLLSLANNHIMDYYDTGLSDTIQLLDRNGIFHAGAGKNAEGAEKPAIIEKNGYRIGLLAYSDMADIIYAGTPKLSFAAGSDKAGVIPRDYETVKRDVEKLRGSVDILAVSLHWGVEESFTVTPEQKEFARKLIDNGVDIILGHHPHQFQGIEIYKGKPIIYSMGNFIFDQNDPENMETFIVNMHYEGKSLKTLTATPVKIEDKSHDELQTGTAAAGMLTLEAGFCQNLGTKADIENDKLVFETGQE